MRVAATPGSPGRHQHSEQAEVGDGCYRFFSLSVCSSAKSIEGIVVSKRLRSRLMVIDISALKLLTPSLQAVQGDAGSWNQRCCLKTQKCHGQKRPEEERKIQKKCNRQ